MTLSPRKTILRELSRAGSGPDRIFVRPSSIRGFGDRPAEYQKAVNELLADRLLEGRRDEEGRMAIAINEHRKAEVARELQPLWSRPVVWMIVGTVAAAAGALLVV